MIAVIFEAWLDDSGRHVYLELAAELKVLLEGAEGLLSIERFASLAQPEKMLSLSFWRDEASLAAWRNVGKHREAQKKGAHGVFKDYHLRVAGVVRDYGPRDRSQAPEDSRVNSP